MTPNEHAISERFGLFDNAYTSGEVSDPGHDWSDAAFANDYVERVWPSTYGGRADGDDTGEGFGAAMPHNGYIWDAAARAHVSFRDYGEMINAGGRFDSSPEVTAPTLAHRYDPKYVGWDLDYSDIDRYREWKREFDSFLARGDLPEFQYLWLPNDHTYGSKPGKFTPAAYIAQNDYGVGLIVDGIRIRRYGNRRRSSLSKTIRRTARTTSAPNARRCTSPPLTRPAACATNITPRRASCERSS